MNEANKAYKPGKGWKALSPAVYELNGRARIHLLGMCRLSDGTWVKALVNIDGIKLHRLIKINGGNRKRGMMAWARLLEESNEH